MIYAIVESGQTVNLIVSEPDVAAALGALPVYDGCAIGQPYDPPHISTEIELTQQAITDLELSDIEQGQAITDLDLADVEQGQNATDLELMILGGT